MKNQYFSLFQLPAQFELDSALLNERYRALSAQCHPDKFAAHSAFEQKQAMMMATTINDAYRTLQDPIQRAAYLLQAQDIDADAPEHTQFAPEFLMQQMEWREALADAHSEQNEQALQQLANEISQAQQDLLQQLQQAFSAQQYETAAQLVRQGRFLAKLQQEIQAALP